MSVADVNLTLEAIKASLAAKLPSRVVSRSLPADVLNVDQAQLRAGLICIVSEGGGDFANYMGREGDLGHLSAAVVGFVLVNESDQPEEVEKAEHALLLDLLNWTNSPGAIHPGGQVLPLDWTQSKQIEHPYGWLVLKLDVRPNP